MMNRLQDAIDFALTNGLIKYNPQFKLTHAPFSLEPFSITSDRLNAIRESTPVFNELMIHVGKDTDFLNESLEKAAKTDGFIRRLLQILNLHKGSHHLQISRNDFLFTEDAESPEDNFPKQVEFNTISNSFIFLTKPAFLLHRYIYSEDPEVERLVFNDPCEEAVDAIAEVFEYYGKPDARLLMVIQQEEQNLFDQRGLEYRLLEKYGIHTVRKTMGEVARQGSLKDGHLRIEGDTIALVYYRAAYTPNDYRQEEDWKGRELIEASSAVTCPSVGMQLAGAKKIQEILGKPGMLERFLSAEKAAGIRSSFAGMYSLDEEVQGKTALQLALESPQDFVLKPQREGGGNNLYSKEMVEHLKTLTNDQKEAYILMERIKATPTPSMLVVDTVAENRDCISEVGRYAACFFDGSSIRFNRDIGYLVRTKAADIDEGGVCAGYACLNNLKVVW